MTVWRSSFPLAFSWHWLAAPLLLISIAGCSDPGRITVCPFLRQVGNRPQPDGFGEPPHS